MSLESQCVEKAQAMADSIHTMSQAMRNFYFKVTGQKHSACKTVASTFVLHDPALRRPHDLDDPFFDPEVQLRIGAVIASTLEKK